MTKELGRGCWAGSKRPLTGPCLDRTRCQTVLDAGRAVLRPLHDLLLLGVAVSAWTSRARRGPIPRRSPYARTYTQAGAPPSRNPPAVRTSPIPATFWRAPGDAPLNRRRRRRGAAPHAMAQFQSQSSLSLHGSTPRGCFKH